MRNIFNMNPESEELIVKYLPNKENDELRFNNKFDILHMQNLMKRNNAKVNSVNNDLFSLVKRKQDNNLSLDNLFKCATKSKGEHNLTITNYSSESFKNILIEKVKKFNRSNFCSKIKLKFSNTHVYDIETYVNTQTFNK